MEIANITVTFSDGTTKLFVPDSRPVEPRHVAVPLGVDVILDAEVPTP